MEKLFILLLLICMRITLNAQEFSNGSIIHDLFGAEQLLEFGTDSSSAIFTNYQDNIKKLSKVKGVKGILRITYFAENKVNKAEVTFLGPQTLRKYLSVIKENADQTFNIIQGGFFSSKLPEIYCIKNFTFIPKEGKLIVICNDYLKPVEHYDEFNKIYSSFIRPNVDICIDNNTYNVYFSEFHPTTGDDRVLFINVEYIGRDWMFINEALILLDDGEVIPIKLVGKRKNNSISCIEVCSGSITKQQAEKILNQQKAKIRISGENFSEDFLLPNMAKSSLKYALFQYEKK